jgi:hypothetical protein
MILSTNAKNPDILAEQQTSCLLIDMPERFHGPNIMASENAVLDPAPPAIVCHAETTWIRSMLSQGPSSLFLSRRDFF